MNARFSLILAAGTLACLTSVVFADTPRAVLIPAIPGGTGTVAYGLNEAGTVVGQADNAAGDVVGFVYSNGTTTELPLLPGGSQGLAHSVNTSGVVVGECKNADGVSRAVKWELGEEGWRVTDLGTLEATGAGLGVAMRINDAGQIVGYSTARVPGGYHACIWDSHGVTDLGTLGFSGNLAYSQGLGINERGEACGFAYGVLMGPEHGLLSLPDNRGRPSDVTPAGRFGLAQWHAINEGSQMAGYVSDPARTQGHFVPATWTARDGISLLPLLEGTTDGYGYDINDAGVAVGVMFLPRPAPDSALFYAFKSTGGVTTTFDAAQLQLPGVMIEARGINNEGVVVGTVDLGFASQAVLIYPSGGVPLCVADVDGDGVVDGNDFVAFINSFSLGVAELDRTADLNHDTTIDGNDFVMFINAFALGC